ncbi:MULTISPECIES: DUF4194 domain-containing protein [unclassified Oceanispirochaeta]|uniref:DUF4194 domain-containing protein n=1 Tax=unclassified Oceanispirochaeta TaxID=2635722 RepID=UPI000E08CE67|nr:MULTISPECIES: DUF4194 domain-containing protein [unclassified Oceanispirochaeta]MBF9015970.1 DUF4194 domain-containing protein [Oceanispirochaeta sp. M2]NPD72433.1 DUF4194 domain-containing protein [Oceanispirochaeta sp. M1]RDG32200.1 DUF4194 domain-containing protein [Oceanispirochaeta sp. M1]
MRDTQSTGESLSLLLIHLLKGVIHRDDNPLLWQDLLKLQAAVRDYMKLLGLNLHLFEDEGFAYLVNTESVGEDEKNPLPRLISRRQLSYPVSLLLALLRKRLAEHDAHSGDERLILEKKEIIHMLAVYFPRSSNEVQFQKKAESWIQRISELSFIRYLGDQRDRVEVQRILSVFIDAQWLNEFDIRLKEYREFGEKERAPAVSREDES